MESNFQYPDDIADPSLVEAESMVCEVPCDEEPLSSDEVDSDCFIITKEDAEKYLTTDQQIELEIMILTINHMKED